MQEPILILGLNVLILGAIFLSACAQDRLPARVWNMEPDLSDYARELNEKSKLLEQQFSSRVRLVPSSSKISIRRGRQKTMTVALENTSTEDFELHLNRCSAADFALSDSMHFSAFGPTFSVANPKECASATKDLRAETLPAQGHLKLTIVISAADRMKPYKDSFRICFSGFGGRSFPFNARTCSSTVNGAAT